MLRQYEYSTRSSEVLGGSRSRIGLAIIPVLIQCAGNYSTNMPGYVLSGRTVFARVNYIELQPATVVYLKHWNVGHSKNHIDE